MFKKLKAPKDAAPVIQTPAYTGMLEKGVPTVKDLIAPASFRREAFDHLGVGSKYVRSFLLAGFPKDIAVRWADGLYNYDGDLDMAIHINPMDERAAMDELTDKITQFEAQLDLETEKGRTSPACGTRCMSCTGSARKSSRTTSACSASR